MALSRNGKQLDLAIGDVGFRLATSQEFPQAVETIPLRKEQFDTENEPGEQSLSGWWRRSQDSFHEGAGNRYQEARGDVTASSGFYRSTAVDPWTKGELRLHPDMASIATGGYRDLQTYSMGGRRINLCIEPSAFTYGLTPQDWATVAGTTGGSPTVVMSNDYVSPYSQGGAAIASFKLTFPPNDGPVNARVTFDFPTESLVPGRLYTLSAYFLAPASTVNLDWGWFTDNGNLMSNEGGYPPGETPVADTWYRKAVTFVAGTPPDNTIELGFTVGFHSTATMTYYVDAVLLEEGPHALPYFDGDVLLSDSSVAVDYSVGPQQALVTNGEVLETLGHPQGPPVSMLDLGGTITATLVNGLDWYAAVEYGSVTKSLAYGSLLPMTATSYGDQAWFKNVPQAISRMAYGKYRVWMIGGPHIYQPTFPEDWDAEPIYSNPDGSWTYTCITEGPASMLFGGYNGSDSAIHAITLDASGGLPELTAPQMVASFPNGERVQEIAVVAGQFLCIGSNRGFRVGVLDGTSATYGPLTEIEGATACTALVPDGNGFLIAFEVPGGEAVAYRVDLSSGEVASGVYPYAQEVKVAGTGHITSLARFDDAIVATDSAGALYASSDTDLAVSGSLTTGRIRFRTSEPKAFKYVELDTDPIEGGSIVVTGTAADGTQFEVGTLDTIGATSATLALPDLGPQRHIELTITLNRDSTDPSLGPVLRSYLVKALPAAKPQRLITIPLLCYDRETSQNGQQYGHDGFAEERLAALQALEDVGDTVTFEDFTTKDGPTTQTVTIESIRFIQTATSQSPGCSGKGGILLVQLRTAEA